MTTEAADMAALVVGAGIVDERRRSLDEMTRAARRDQKF